MPKFIIPIISAIILLIILLVISIRKGFRNTTKEKIVLAIVEIIVAVITLFVDIFPPTPPDPTPPPMPAPEIIIQTEAPVITLEPTEIIIDEDNYINQYLTAMTRAINQNKFSEVEPYLKLGSDAYEEQKEYIQYAEEKGITEVLSGVEILSTESKDDNTIVIETYETYDIFSTEKGSRTSSFNTQYTLENVDGEWKITKINNSNVEQ